MHSHLKFCIEELWTNNFYSFFFKAAFELAVNDFKKSFFVKLACLATAENRISGKWFQFDRNFTPLTRKWFYTFILPSNHFRVTRRREREREKERVRDSTEERSHQHPAPAKARSIHIQELQRTQKTQDWARSSSNAPIIRSWTHSLDRRARPLNPFLRSSSSSVEPIPQITNPNRPPKIVPPNHRSTCSGSISSPIRLLSDFWVDLWLDEFFFVGYWEFGFWWIWILLELMIYLFGSWENARKCEKHDKIGFFRVFSRIQPNTRKYFGMQPNTGKYFPFLKIAFPENIYFPKNILHEPNTA